MSDFPWLRPATRQFSFGQYPVSLQTGFGGGTVRFLHGIGRSAVTMELTYENLTQAEAKLIRDHYRLRQGSHQDFFLPELIWAGHSTAYNIVPQLSRWKYGAMPEETQKRGGYVDLAVTLVCVTYITSMDVFAPGMGGQIDFSLSAGSATGGGGGGGGGGGDWTPADIATALWLDASDAGTLTIESGAVSQWNDKSGNSRNVTQSSSTLRPAFNATGFNSLPAVVFDGSNDLLSLPTSIPLATTNSFDVFVVAAPNTSGRQTTYGAGVVARFPGSDVAGSFYAGYDGNGRLVIQHHLTSGNNETGLLKTPSSTFASQATVIAHYQYDSSGGAAPTNRWQMRLNGAAALSKTVGSTASGWGVNNSIGSAYPPSSQYSFNGAIAEIVITESAVTATDRQKVEGYLAHKWDLAGSLPVDHPYKSSAP